MSVTKPFERRLAGNRRACIREIEDLLAQAASVRDVTPEQVANIATQHGVDIRTRLGTARRELYRRLLEHCLADQELSEEETADIGHLQRVLLLADTDAAEVHDQVARAVYGQAIDQVLADHRLDPEEAEFLRRLGGALAIPDAARDHRYGEAERRARRRSPRRARPAPLRGDQDPRRARSRHGGALAGAVPGVKLLGRQVI